MNNLILVVALIWASSVWAQNQGREKSSNKPTAKTAVKPEAKAEVEEPAKPEEEAGVVKEAGKKMSQGVDDLSAALDTTMSYRQNSSFYILGTYSPIDLMIPGKMGATVGLVQNVDTTWEFEFLRGSLAVPFLVKDLGKATDTRYSFMRRSYFGGNSFNVSYGLTYFTFSLELGDELLSRLSAGSYPYIGVLDVQSLGFNVGIGNRWILAKHIVLGIDWVSWAQPVLRTKRHAPYLDYVTNADDKSKVDTALSLITYMPRLVFLKLQAGVTF